MAENVAALLSYVLGWVTGLIFFFIDKRPFVRFHAAQSIVVFGGLQILYIIIERVFFVGVTPGFFSFGNLLLTAIEIIAFVLWIVLMIRAYQGERYRVPVAADLSDRLMGK